MSRRWIGLGIAVGLVAIVMVWASAVDRGVRDATPSLGRANAGRDADLPIERYSADAREAVATASGVPDAQKSFSVSGRVVDESGAPVPHVGVALGRPGERSPASARTDAHGGFRFEGVSRGRVQIVCWSFGNSERQERDLIVKRDAHVELTVPGFLSLAGTVHAPLADDVEVGLTWLDQSGHMSLAMRSPCPLQTPVDERGRFAFGGLLPGCYRIDVRSRLHARHTADVWLTHSRDDLEIELEPGLELAGRVLTEREGDVSVGLAALETVGSGVAPDGSFRLYPLPAGAQRLCFASGSKMQLLERFTTVELDHSLHDWTWDLRQSASVRLALRRADRAPVAVSLRLEAANGGTEAALWYGSEPQPWIGDGAGSECARPDGLLDLGRHAHGDWTLSIGGIGVVPAQIAFELRGEDVTLTHVLARRRGQVVRCETGVAHYTIESRPSGSRSAWELVLWSNERVSVCGLPEPGIRAAFLTPGLHDFRLRTAEHATRILERVSVSDDAEDLYLVFDDGTEEHAGSFEALPAAKLEATARVAVLRRPGSQAHPGLRGTVLSPAGHPLSGVWLHVARFEDDAWHPLRTKSAHVFDGEFVIPGLDPGLHRLGLDPEVSRPLAEVEVGEPGLFLELAVPAE